MDFDKYRDGYIKSNYEYPMTTSILVFTGASGWHNSAWREGFYPPDLPEDWLLPFYNTQFDAVYLPEDAWIAVAPEVWDAWLNETREGFVFVLEAGRTARPAPVSPRVILADPAWLAGHVWWLDEAPDMRALSGCISAHAASGEPLFVFSRSGNLTLLEQANTLKQVMGY